MAKKRGWGFDTTYLDRSVRPQDDFYRFAVGGWLKRAQIPESESRWGTFNIVRKRTDTQLHGLLKELSKKRRVVAGSPEQMIRDAYNAARDMKTRARVGIAPLAPWRTLISAVRTPKDLEEAIIRLHDIGTGGLWGFDVDQDMKRSDRYILHIYQSGLGMPDRDYYVKQGPEQKRVRSAYEKHIERMMGLVGCTASEAVRIRKNAMQIEMALARASMTKEELRIPEKSYHRWSRTKLKRFAPQFDWEAYFRAMQVDPKELIVMQPDFLKKTMHLLKSASLEAWRDYLLWHLVNDHAGCLTPALEKQNFAFYATCLSGMKKMKPRWRIALGAVDYCVGEQLGKLYVAKYFGPEAKRKVQGIVDDLVVAYERRIRELDWMGPATKRMALKKLKGIATNLAYPDKWKSYRGLRIRPDDHVGNLRRALDYEWRRAVRKLDKPVDRKEWFTYPHVVNAFYSPVLNNITFPAGILQHPFFDFDADDALNYGAMGAVIGHELTHGFDDEGSKFDAVGNLRNWWTKKDRSRFEAKADLVRKQFDRYTVADGLHVNGTLTLGENIADLGGLVIGFDAYQRHLEKTGRKTIGGFTPEQRFFLAAAQFESAVARPELEKLLVLTDPHSPPEFRVNGPVSNMTEFYDAFGVKPGDKLYRSQAKRAKIW